MHELCQIKAITVEFVDSREFLVLSSFFYRASHIIPCLVYSILIYHAKQTFICQ